MIRANVFETSVNVFEFLSDVRFYEGVKRENTQFFLCFPLEKNGSNPYIHRKRFFQKQRRF